MFFLPQSKNVKFGVEE